MRNLYIFFLLFLVSVVNAQRRNLKATNNLGATFGQKDTTRVLKGTRDVNGKEKPSYRLYKIYNLEQDTTYVDTTLSIQKEYKYNYLRKDNFGLIAFANEGQTYNTLDFSWTKSTAFPQMGFKAKHFNYLESNEIRYYNVPTPLSDLYFKTVMEQGQSLDAFLSVNTKPNLNFSIAYKGLRSIGKYINNISSSGNFRFTSSYFTKDKRYILNAHFTGQDISNQENGGIQDVDLFELSEDPYTERDRLEVYFRDAESLLKGNRFFVDHSFKLNKNSSNNLIVFHQFNHEYKFFEFTQPTISERLGVANSNSINNKTRYNHLYNKLGVSFSTKSYGDLKFFAENNTYNYFYNSVVYNNVGDIAVPNAINDRITSLGGNYTYNIGKLRANLLVSNAITDQSISNIELSAKYAINEDYKFEFKYQKLNSLPSLNYTLYQSTYIDYNWYNNFKNEKRNEFKVVANTKLLNFEFKYATLNDYLYFYNTTEDITKLTVKPFQYDKTINYLAIKASKEFRVGKFALDNTILYQNVTQDINVLNVPELVTRNTLYFSEHVFKKAMFLQTGITFNYFTKYFANDYNPLLGEFYVQNQQQIGDFPMLDFFVNAKVKQIRLFLKAEHFNSAWTGYDFYAAPNYPYRDFIVRFGVVWNFFK
jgi:hypothetical protein